MSTTINVTVDDGGLPAKNRQQTAANRQAFVQGQASQQAAQQGADQRAADRRAAGLDPATGRPLASAGASSRLPRIQQEPAANRIGGPPNFVLVPHQDFVLNSVPKNTLAAKTKGIKSKSFFEFLFSNPEFNRIGASAVFVPSGGPGGAPFLQAPQATQDTGFYDAYLEFPLCDNSDVLDVIADDTERYTVLTSNGPVVPTQVKKPVHKLKEYTVESYFRGDTSFPPIGTIGGRAEMGMGYADYAGVYSNIIWARLQYNTFHDFGPSSYLYSLYVQGFDGFELEIFFDSYWLDDPNGPNASMPSYGYIWPELLRPSEWYHLALVKTETSQSIYFQGTLVASALTDFSPLANLPDKTPVIAQVSFESGGVRILRPSLSGFRFTPRALYTGPFTPPESITSLA